MAQKEAQKSTNLQLGIEKNFQPENRYTLDAPMPWLPSIEERTRYIDGSTLEVANHEAIHFFAGLADGHWPKEISLIPEGNSLGHTSYDNVSLNSMQRIAAATVGRAPGAGSDLYKAKLIEKQTGNSTEAARQAVDLHLYSSAVGQRFINILAYFEYADTNLAKQILLQAEYEIDHEYDEQHKSHDFERNFSLEEQKDKEESSITFSYKKNEHGEFDTRIITSAMNEKGDLEEKSVTVCGTCHAENGHFVPCSAFGDSYVVKTEDDKIIPLSSKSNLPLDPLQPLKIKWEKRRKIEENRITEIETELQSFDPVREKNVQN